MGTHLKINIAIFISTAFIFRLLFINIGLLPSFDSTQSNKLLAKHLSSIQQRRGIAETCVVPYSNDQTITEIGEEITDNFEDITKSNSPVILSVFYSFLKGVTLLLISGSLYNTIKCNLYPRKYLALSILRI